MAALDVASHNEHPDVCEVLQLMGSPFDKSDDDFDEVNYCLTPEELFLPFTGYGSCMLVYYPPKFHLADFCSKLAMFSLYCMSVSGYRNSQVSQL